MKKEKDKAAVYCRLSEEDRNKALDDESRSIQNQKIMLTEYAKEAGWEIYDIYSDEDYAGADRNRPQFNRMINDARAGKFQIVLCKTQSRFTRELEIVEKYIHGLFVLWGIRFVSVVDHGDSNNKGNKKARQINGLINEWYLEDLSENIKSVLTLKRKEGCHIGSSALYGYVKNPEKKGGLVIDEKAACVVRRIYDMYLSGTGKTEIAKVLNRDDIPTPGDYKKLTNGKEREGYKWHYITVTKILSEEMYTGNMVQGRFGSISYKNKINRMKPRDQWIRVEGTHQPIIERKLWEEIQEMQQKRRKAAGSEEIHPFSGKVRCRCCGRKLWRKTSHGKYYLQCRTTYLLRGTCEGAFISAELLEDVVLEHFNSAVERLLPGYNVEKILPEEVDFFIDYIEIGRKDKNTGKLPVEIYWKF